MHSSRLAVMLKGDHYSRFQDEMFLFDKHIDCISWGNDMFILKKDNFQKIFRFFELLRAMAHETLKVIKQHIPIDDFEGFSSACEKHLLKLSKLKNISSKPYLKTITMTDIKKVIKKFDLQITTVGTGADEKIHFDASDKWAILKLLDDDYLESVMTGTSYEVNSKRPLE